MYGSVRLHGPTTHPQSQCGFCTRFCSACRHRVGFWLDSSLVCEAGPLQIWVPFSSCSFDSVLKHIDLTFPTTGTWGWRRCSSVMTLCSLFYRLFFNTKRHVSWLSNFENAPFHIHKFSPTNCTIGFIAAMWFGWRPQPPSGSYKWRNVGRTV